MMPDLPLPSCQQAWCSSRGGGGDARDQRDGGRPVSLGQEAQEVSRRQENLLQATEDEAPHQVSNDEPPFLANCYLRIFILPV